MESMSVLLSEHYLPCEQLSLQDLTLVMSGARELRSRAMMKPSRRRKSSIKKPPKSAPFSDDQLSGFLLIKKLAPEQFDKLMLNRIFKSDFNKSLQLKQEKEARDYDT